MKGVLCVLDASAFLAYIHGETGKERVSDVLGRGVAMSAVNWTEVLSKLSLQGISTKKFTEDLTNKGLLGQCMIIIPFTAEDAEIAADIFIGTRSHGLSLGDRACLALAKRLKLPVLTSDRAWKGISFPVQIELIR